MYAPEVYTNDHIYTPSIFGPTLSQKCARSIISTQKYARDKFDKQNYYTHIIIFNIIDQST